MRLIVAITGASGAIYGVRLLQELKARGVETYLVISEWGRRTIEAETDYDIEGIIGMAGHYYDSHDFLSPIASGSTLLDGMVVAPCSMKTLSGIRHGYADNLVIRAADVSIKERRRLILLVRETPLSPIHLENMLELSRLGVTIMPPVPSFYNRPFSLEDVIDQSVFRVLDQLGLDAGQASRWGE